MEHVQFGYEGSSIETWEREHGFHREIRNGCEYVYCDDWGRFQEQCERERQDRFRMLVAEQQAEAYGVQ